MGSVFFQVPTQNEDPFTVVCNSNFLCKLGVPCQNGFEVLKITIPGQNDVDFETIADLTKGGREVGKPLEMKETRAHLDMTLSSTRE